MKGPVAMRNVDGCPSQVSDLLFVNDKRYQQQDPSRFVYGSVRDYVLECVFDFGCGSEPDFAEVIQIGAETLCCR